MSPVLLGPLFAPVLGLWSLLLGMLVGSFLNVVIYRVPLGRSVVLPPSACTACNTPLAWQMNIPVLSYLVQLGTCRYCGTRFSPRYAVLELISGLFFLLCHTQYGLLSVEFLKAVVLFSFCLVVFFIDLDHWIIPDGLNLAGVLTGLVFSVVVPLGDIFFLRDYLGPIWASLAWSVIGVAVGLLFFWSIQVVGLILVKQEAMGGGDVKFAALVGAFLGPVAAFWSFLMSFFLGALFAVPLLVVRRGGGKEPIPFGTFMAVSAIGFLLVDYSLLWERLDLFVGGSMDWEG